MRLGILGCGFTGRAIARRFAADGIPVWGTTRSEENFAPIEAAGAEALVFTGDLTGALREALATTTHLVISIAPPREEGGAPDATVDPTLIAFGDVTLVQIAPKLEWIVYLSTVGVYGDHDGAWVDEETEVRPVSARSRQRVRAEAEWLALGEATGLPVAIMRLSGIYGPGRNGLRNAARRRTRRLVKPGQVFNRIRVEDIAAAVRLAADLKAPGLFNITDDEALASIVAATTLCSSCPPTSPSTAARRRSGRTSIAC